MRGGRLSTMARAGALSLGLLLLAGYAGGDPRPGVELFSPLGSVERVEQIKLRFSTPMVAFGDPRLTAPLTGSCSGGATGRWVDARTFAIDLPVPLQGGQRCRYALVPGLKDAGGSPVAARRFDFDTGGPNVRAEVPETDGGMIEEDQIFLLALNTAPTPASVEAAASCRIEGVGEVVPLDLLPATTRDTLVTGGARDWRLRQFLTTAGWRKDDDNAEKQPRAEIIAARCRRALPSGGRVAIVWGAGISTAGGLATTTANRLEFKVRQAFRARFECSRENPAAACSPISPLRVAFTGQVPVALAKQIRLVAADGTALSPKPTKRRISQSDEDDGGTTGSHVQTVDHVEFAGPFVERTSFKLTLPANLVDDAGRPLVNAARFPLDVATADAPPLVKFAGTFGILEANEGGVLPVTLRAVEASVAGQSLAPIGGRDIDVATDGEVAAWLRRLAKAEERTEDELPTGTDKRRRYVETTRQSPLIAPGTPARALTIAKPNGARAFEVVGIPLSAKGFHVVELASPRLGASLLGPGKVRYVATGALVTDMAVHFQWGHGRSLAWVTRLSDAQPVAGAKIAVLDSCDSAELWRGVTDASGRALVPGGLPEPEGYGSCEPYSRNHPLIVSARADGDYSFTLTDWNKGIQPGDFQLPTGYGYDHAAYVTVFDRTLLRAGETVSMKHIVRARTDAGFGWVQDLPADPSVVIRHVGSDQTYELPLAFRSNGSAETRWTVPKAAALGEYTVEIGSKGSTDRRTSGTFTVEEFRLPTIRARVSGPNERQIAPVAVPLDLTLAYLSGGAVGKAPVKLRTQVEPRTVSVPDYDGWSFDGEPLVAGIVPLDGGDEPATQGPLRARVEPVALGPNGTARVVVDKLIPVTRPSTLVAEMDYDDANGEVATVSSRIALDPAGLRVGIKRDGWMAKSDDLRLKLVALDLDNRPIKGQRVAVKLFSRETYSYRKRLIGGFYSYDNSRETKLLDASCDGTTDDKGLLSCQLDAGVSGEVIAQATARDASGRVAQATSSVWLAGSDDWWFGGDNGDRMDVVAEAPEYAAGGTAKFQVRMPFRSATALVSVLRDGVIDSFVTELSGKDPVVSVRLARGYAPDIYVSVLAVRGRVAGWRIWLADFARRWHLPWISREASAPTSLIDLAKPSYRFGMAKIRVGWDDHRLGVKVATDAPSYAVRKVAHTSIAVTPPRGRTLPAASEVAFAAVDEALLQLKDNRSWELLETMMADRPLMVQTSTAQSQIVGKRHYGRKALAAGGGGGAEAGGTVRRDFQPLLLWRGSVPLDASGHANLDVPLNDSLSSFRFVAVATGGADLFGTGKTVVRTTQDLQILAGIPPLVREGDRYVATVLLRNTTAKPMQVTATGHAGPAALAPRLVEIPAAGAVTVGWSLIAPPATAASGTIEWAIDANAASGAKDAVRVPQLVVPAVPVETLQATLVQLTPSTDFPVAIPADALPGRGGLDVALSRSLGGALPGVRAYMAAYPYDCIEQQLSRAVALGDHARWEASAALLPAYLDRDGLVRYFPADWILGDDALTAYILRLSADSRWALPADARAKMIAGLTNFVGGRTERSHARVLVVDKGSGDATLASFGSDGASRRLGAIVALAANGAATPAMLEPLSITPDNWPTIGVIDWAYILRKLPGVPGGAASLERAQHIARARLDLQGTRLTIARADDPWQTLASPDTTAARLLTTFADMAPWRSDIAGLARGLMLKQQHGHWDTTVANAVGTLAMADFSRRFESAPVTGTTTASVGTATQAFAWGSAGSPPPALLAWPAARSDLRLSHTGSGAPWAIVTARAAVPLKAPFASGFALRRSVSAVTQAVPGKWSRGDVMRVRIEFTARAPVEWVVINDPVPSGATVLGGSLGGRSQVLAAGDTSGLQPTFVERRSEAVHAHYAAVPKAMVAYEYTLQLNSEGVFKLPPTRVEALYSPEMFAAVPNAVIEVGAAK